MRCATGDVVVSRMVARTPKRVMVVEDEPTLQRIFGSLLIDAGHDVVAVGTAEEALARIKDPSAPQTDVVLCDKNLPGMDGVALLVALQSVPSAPRFVLATGYPSRDSALACLRARADGYLVKPFRSLAVASDAVTALCNANVHAYKTRVELAWAIAAAVEGTPMRLPGSITIVHDLEEAHARHLGVALADVGVLLSVAEDTATTVGPVALLATSVEQLVQWRAKYPMAPAVLCSAAAPLASIIELISIGGGALAAVSTLNEPA